MVRARRGGGEGCHLVEAREDAVRRGRSPPRAQPVLLCRQGSRNPNFGTAFAVGTRAPTRRRTPPCSPRTWQRVSARCRALDCIARACVRALPFVPPFPFSAGTL